MSDSDKTLKLVIEAQDSASGTIKQIQAEKDALTNTGTGLATAPPTDETKKFTIATEAEYVAVVKSAEALRTRIPVMQAAGKETAEMEAALLKLDTALSSEQALNIARNLEGKKWLAQRLEEITATEAATAATEKNIVANKLHADSVGVSSYSLREMVVVANELERGNFTRLPGSVARLAASFDLLGALINPVTIGLAGAGVVTYLFYENMMKAVDAANQLADNYRRLDEAMGSSESLDAAAAAYTEISEKGEAAAKATNDLADASHKLTTATDAANAALKQQQGFGNEELEAEKKAKLEAIKAAETSGQITPAQAAAQTRDLENQYRALADIAKSQSEQKEIDNLKADREKQQAIADEAAGKVGPAGRAVSGAEYDVSKAKDELESAKEDVKAQEKFLREHELSTDEFKRQQAQLFNLVARQVEKETAVGDAATRANQAKADAAALQKGLDEATAAVKSLDQKISALQTAHTASDTHREKMEGFGHQEQIAQYQRIIAQLVKQDEEKYKMLDKLFQTVANGHAIFHAIIQNHIEKTTSVVAEQQALWNALNSLGLVQANVRNSQGGQG